MIRPVKPEDADAICGIYNPYVLNTAVSFEETPVSTAEMEGRILSISARYPYLVWEEKEAGLIGYAYINQWKERVSYRFSAELSIYLKEEYHGKGIGSRLMARLLEELRGTSIHALVSGITLPNEKSVALHEKFGFKEIARFNEIGFKMNRWLDVGYWELAVPLADTDR
jgi:phosphinothricin acetyltransferase